MVHSQYKVFVPYLEVFRRNRITGTRTETTNSIQAYENENEDCLLVADILGVNRSTARGIVARFIREGRIHTELSKQCGEPFTS